MAFCISCGEEYSDERRKLGYRLCKVCGERLAKIHTDLKSQRVAPHYNKGTYQYLTDGMDLKSLQKKI
jgi:hypothetical protein